MEDAATVDVRAAYLLPIVLDVIGNDPVSATDKGVRSGPDPEITLLKSWLTEGAHRVDRARTGAYSDQAAIALWDQWYPLLAKAVLRGTLGALVDALPASLDDSPTQGRGSAWNNVAWYGYVSKDLRQVLGEPVQGRYSRTYCGGGSLAACRTQLQQSLVSAVAALSQREHTADPSMWTYDKTLDDIRPTAYGIVGVPPIDWQNRPTFQQVVSFPAHRPR
jgi:hypothetical protein